MNSRMTYAGWKPTCFRRMPPAIAHAFGECAEWADLRLPPIVDIMRQAPTSGLHVAASILGIVPPHRLWRHILRWSLQIDRAASAFWQQRID